ncbi:MAG: DUF2752 domain-containing protein [Planctomycetales bacterium]|nr:DUF2752 domain-containing protein [Planctomycetales bacterium]
MMSLPNASCHPPAALPGRAVSDMRWRYHACLLGLTVAVLLAAGGMEIHHGRQVVLPLLGPLPAACVWNSLWSTHCPGCGLTRSIVSLMHADPAAAWGYNPAGLLIFAIALYQIPFRTIQLKRLARGAPDYRHGPWTLQAAIWAAVTALVAQWLWRTVL